MIGGECREMISKAALSSGQNIWLPTRLLVWEHIVIGRKAQYLLRAKSYAFIPCTINLGYSFPFFKEERLFSFLNIRVKK